MSLAWGTYWCRCLIFYLRNPFGGIDTNKSATYNEHWSSGTSDLVSDSYISELHRNFNDLHISNDDNMPKVKWNADVDNGNILYPSNMFSF